MKTMMIDYRNENGIFVRREIDNFEFCVREGLVYFISGGVKYSVPLQNLSQVYID